MEFTVGDVARMRLVSQGLIAPSRTVAEVVGLLACVQGQDHPGSMISLALRAGSTSTVPVREAYDRGEIVRSWPMRGTLFVTTAEDAGWIGGLTAEKTRRSTERRRERLGLSTAVLDRAESVAMEALSGRGLTRAEILRRWTEAGIDTADGRGYHHLFHLAVRGSICLGPTDGPKRSEQRFVLASEWIRAPRRPDRATGIRELLARYIAARGPVPLDDFCWWSKLGKVEARAALRELAPGLTSAEVGGRDHWMTPDLPDRYAQAKRRTAAPLLLPGFDELVLGYGDRSAVLTPEEERLVVPGGNGVFKGTVVHRGHAVGTWRRGTGTTVDVTPFGALPTSVERALPRLADALPV